MIYSSSGAVFQDSHDLAVNRDLMFVQYDRLMQGGVNIEGMPEATHIEDRTNDPPMTNEERFLHAMDTMVAGRKYDEDAAAYVKQNPVSTDYLQRDAGYDDIGSR